MLYYHNAALLNNNIVQCTLMIVQLHLQLDFIACTE